MEITVRVGGEAGQGIQFIGSTLAKIFSRGGLHVFTHQDYMSRIKGGHNFYQIRVAELMANSAAVGAILGGLGLGLDFFPEVLRTISADMSELPLVVAEVQRPGPATGLPTRTEQGDLLFVLYGGHGEFPKVLFTPGTPEQAINLTNNQVYGLTKGQASPTSVPAFVSKTQPFGNPSEPLDPLALAIAMDCSFVARGFAGADSLPRLQNLMRKAMEHR